MHEVNCLRDALSALRHSESLEKAVFEICKRTKRRLSLPSSQLKDRTGSIYSKRCKNLL